MPSRNIRITVTGAVLCLTPCLLATGPAIGFVMANGSFQLDRSTIRGNASLWEGSTLETGKAASQLDLNNGSQIKLAADSRVRVYAGHTVLEQGIGELHSSTPYPIEAGRLLISSAEPNTVAQVRLDGAEAVEVAALSGAVRVTNASGVVVGNLMAGMGVAFSPQTGAPPSTTVSGCLLKKMDEFILVLPSTTRTLELRGPGLTGELGNRVRVTGVAATTPPMVTGASQVMNVTAVNRVARGGCVNRAKAVGAVGAGAAAAGTAAGISTAAGVAIAGGVAAAGTLGGLAAAGTFSSRNLPASTSR